MHQHCKRLDMTHTEERPFPCSRSKNIILQRVPYVRLERRKSNRSIHTRVLYPRIYNSTICALSEQVTSQTRHYHEENPKTKISVNQSKVKSRSKAFPSPQAPTYSCPPVFGSIDLGINEKQMAIQNIYKTYGIAAHGTGRLSSLYLWFQVVTEVSRTSFVLPQCGAAYLGRMSSGPSSVLANCSRIRWRYNL